MAHHPNHPQHHQHPKRKQVHKDWRTWTVVILMLAAMALYVVTLDDAVVPGGEPLPAMDNAEAE